MKDPMASTTRRPRAKKSAVVLPENRTPSEVIADTIIASYNDLAPSVRRIMEADLPEPGRLHAITAFQQSLGQLGDPMRNPANAIAAGQAVDPSEVVTEPAAEEPAAEAPVAEAPVVDDAPAPVAETPADDEPAIDDEAADDEPAIDDEAADDEAADDEAAVEPAATE
jgi:hypothetical protein